MSNSMLLDYEDRWCPFGRLRWRRRKDDGDGWTTTHGDGSFNRVANKIPGPQEAITPCIGPECMAFRMRQVVVGADYIMDGLSGGRVVNKTALDGYCGIAGRPE